MRNPSTISTNSCSSEGFRLLCLRNLTGSLRHESTSLIIASMWSASSTQREHDCDCLRHDRRMYEQEYNARMRFIETLLSYCLNPQLSSGTADSSWGINKAFRFSAEGLNNPDRMYGEKKTELTLKYESCAIMQLFGICWCRL